MSDELAIVIPAKNEEKLLPRLLRSLTQQDYPLMPFTRVFLADASSTDGTLSIAKRFENILAITVIAGGLPSIGRNRGAQCAYSRYVLFVDADIELADPTLLRRAIDLMKTRSLHCVTTDIFCRDGIWLDHLLYICNNMAQRFSRFHRPFATGMFMLVDLDQFDEIGQIFDEIGGFDELALYAEDYQLTRQFERNRFRVIRGGIFTTNRRFRRMGHWRIARAFLSTAVNGHKPDYFRNEQHKIYWEAYY
jgi:glycosyltransferase involved in cell wall biosynthesis